MKINLNQIIKAFDGTPIVLGEEEIKPLTLLTVCYVAIGANDNSYPAAKRPMLYNLGNRIAEEVRNKNYEVDFNAEEIAALKVRIDNAYSSPLISGKAKELLDPPPEKPKKKKNEPK